MRSTASVGFQRLRGRGLKSLLRNFISFTLMGGSAKKPKDPPAAPAPVRADSAAGEQAPIVAGRREGLRKTINPDNPLAPKSSLGSIGSLGMGGEGVMINTRTSTQPKYTQTFQGGRRI